MFCRVLTAVSRISAFWSLKKQSDQAGDACSPHSSQHVKRPLSHLGVFIFRPGRPFAHRPPLMGCFFDWRSGGRQRFVPKTNSNERESQKQADRSHGLVLSRSRDAKTATGFFVARFQIQGDCQVVGQPEGKARQRQGNCQGMVPEPPTSDCCRGPPTTGRGVGGRRRVAQGRVPSPINCNSS